MLYETRFDSIAIAAHTEGNILAVLHLLDRLTPSANPALFSAALDYLLSFLDLAMPERSMPWIKLRG